MNPRNRLLIATVLSLPIGCAVAQQNNNLETIYVESVNRVETPISEVSRSVTVVTKDDIEKQQTIDRSIGEILSKTVPGFSQSTEALTDFGQTLRGRTFLTLIDGVPQTMPLRDGRRSLNSIDPAAVEQIEVVRGGTAVYGFGASGGVVNIITKRPGDGDREINLDIGAKTSLTETGSDAFGWNTGITASGRKGQVDYLFNGSVLSTGASFDSDGDRRIPMQQISWVNSDWSLTTVVSASKRQ